MRKDANSEERKQCGRQETFFYIKMCISSNFREMFQALEEKRGKRKLNDISKLKQNLFERQQNLIFYAVLR
jgi:hypothetical protein